MAVKKLLGWVAAVGLIIVLSGLLAVYRPWDRLQNLPLFNSTTALTVNSPQGKAEVYLDSSKVGETPFSSENLAAGDHLLTVERISSAENFYEPFTRQISLERNTRTFVEVEIGPSNQFTSYKVIYYQKNGSTAAEVYVTTDPKQCQISVDEVRYGAGDIASDVISAGRHTLSVTHPGYEPEETTIITREGYTLIADIQLMAKPIDISTTE